MIALMSLRRLREGDALEDADVVLARGSELGQAMLQAYALQCHCLVESTGSGRIRSASSAASANSARRSVSTRSCLLHRIATLSAVSFIVT
jgi:hypothetical protein